MEVVPDVLCLPASRQEKFPAASQTSLAARRLLFLTAKHFYFNEKRHANGDPNHVMFSYNALMFPLKVFSVLI